MGKRRYNVNDDYFKKWSSNMAYVLGLWFADGYIDSKKNIFSICQHKKDQYLLRMILQEMQSACSLTSSGNTKVLKITSKKIVEDIVRLGGKPCKSLDVKFPSIPKKFLPDFIRGLWDGDGCISNQKWRGYNYYRASLSSGSKKFIYELKEVLNKNMPFTKGFVEKKNQKRGTIIKGRALKKDSVVYQFNFGINDTRRLRDFMYYDESNFKMIRKYKKFQEAGAIKFTRPVIMWPYIKAKKHIHKEIITKFGINTKNKWLKYVKNNQRSKYIPADPFKTYKNTGWIDWYDWLGKDRPKSRTV